MIKNIFLGIGQYLLLLKTAFSKPEKISMYWKETVRQMYDIGIGSLLIVFLISLFIGAVTALQFAYQIEGGFIPIFFIGYIVRDITIIEMAPTITCLVLAGKVGSNIASEIGGMRQKEHIDAMEIMGLNTANYLLTPKLIAALTVIPLLVAFSALMSIGGGYLASVPTGIITTGDYVRGLRSFYNPDNVALMFLKSFVFAYILTTISFYLGYYVKGGSIELGKASTNAVVFSDICILIADYLIALLFYS